MVVNQLQIAFDSRTDDSNHAILFFFRLISQQLAGNYQEKPCSLIQTYMKRWQVVIR